MADPNSLAGRLSTNKYLQKAVQVYEREHRLLELVPISVIKEYFGQRSAGVIDEEIKWHLKCRANDQGHPCRYWQIFFDLSTFVEDVKSLALLDDSKCLALTALVEHGQKVFSRRRICHISNFIVQARKLDTVALPMCKAIAGFPTLDELEKIYEMIRKGRTAVKHAFKSSPKPLPDAYFLHSMAILAKEHSMRTGWMVLKKIGGSRGFPDELVEMINRYYVVDKKLYALEEAEHAYKTRLNEMENGAK